MSITEINLAIASVSLGAFFGAIGIKLVTDNNKTSWKWAFYILGWISILSAILECIIVNSQLKILDYFIITALIGSGILVITFTKRFLNKKFIYKTSELDPIINKFTSLSDKSEIRLFGGDLNFFGDLPTEMDQNKQYNFLQSLNFKRTLILCEEPKDTLTKIRYGKILNELNGVELRFYKPEEADLRIRGRMKTIQGIEKLLIYTKIPDTGDYQTIETDTANSSGALYNNIWKLVWSLAPKLSDQYKNEYIDLFKNKRSNQVK